MLRRALFGLEWMGSGWMTSPGGPFKCALGGSVISDQGIHNYKSIQTIFINGTRLICNFIGMK